MLSVAMLGVVMLSAAFFSILSVGITSIEIFIVMLSVTFFMVMLSVIISSVEFCIDMTSVIKLSVNAGNTKGGSITVPLTSCLTSLN
jgi:hypothetical protein